MENTALFRRTAGLATVEIGDEYITSKPKRTEYIGERERESKRESDKTNN
mgnify:CR=1 FL=1